MVRYLLCFQKPQLILVDPDVFEARAIILGNMGEHRQALSIYVFDMIDTNKAEEYVIFQIIVLSNTFRYCNHVYLNNTTSGNVTSNRTSTSTDEIPSSIYNVLLSLYLSPQKPHEPQWDPAIDLLAKHGARLPASSTLDLIPEVFTVKKLESYFKGRIRGANSIVNESRIVAGLRKTLDFAEESKLRLGEGLSDINRGRNRCVIITEDRVCGMCHKRFGGSAIKILSEYVFMAPFLSFKPTNQFSSNAVVHYGCSVR